MPVGQPVYNTIQYDIMQKDPYWQAKLDRAQALPQIMASIQAQQKAQQTSAGDQLRNWLLLNQSYGGGLSPTPSVQGAASTLMGSPQQQLMGSLGFPQKGNILPEGPQNKAIGQANMDLIKYLTGQGLGEDTAVASVMGLPMLRAGQLNQAGYTQLANDLSTGIERANALVSAGKAKTLDEAKMMVYSAYMSQYGPTWGAKIKQSLWPMGTTAELNQQLIAALSGLKENINQ